MTPAPLLHARRPSAYVLIRRNDALTRALREADRAADARPLRFLVALVVMFLVCTLWRTWL